MKNKVTKDEWVDMFREIGLSDEQMMKWHSLYEARHPESHADFLAMLGIPADEITAIRSKCAVQ